MQPAIQTHGLTKRYKNFHAVNEVSLSIDQGEIYGFIGLNGSGKTTTIRMLLGLITPTSGHAEIKGEKVTARNHHLWKNVGHIVETPHSYPELTVAENLEIYQRLRLVSDPDAVKRVMDQLNLTRYAKTRTGKLSLGNAQRLGIAKALIHSPDILILDEPMNGLDPSGIVEVRRRLQHLASAEGVTILMSSHLLSEVALIATRVGIIHEGRLIDEMDTSRLDVLLDRKLIVNTRDNKTSHSILEEAGYTVSINADGHIEVLDESVIQNPDDIARLLVARDVPPTRLVVTEENLESYFLKIIAEGGRP